MDRPQEPSPDHRESSLDYDQLLRFHELEADDREELWSALEKLSYHLDDHLFLIDRRDFDAGIPHSLITFKARDREETRLYAVVTTTGAVIVGCCDELAQVVIAQLDDFDPLWHEVVSVAASGRHRLVGDNIDLWIVVRRSPEDPEEAPKTVAYHALVWLDDHGAPLLRPARDDGPNGDTSSWHAGSADRLPAWLRSWTATCPPDDDPLAEDGLSPVVLDQLSPLTRRAGSGIKAVVRGRRWIAVSTGDEIVLLAAEHEQPVAQSSLRLSMPDRAGALALLEGPGPSPRGIAAFDARRLVAFGVDSDGLQTLWEQSRHELALGLAFLGQAQPPGLPWPDLLVLYRDGRLERLRYLGSDAMRRLWRECWLHLGSVDLESRLAVAREMENQPEIRRRAVLIGIIEALLSELPLVDHKTRRQRLETIAELFRSTETIPVLEAGIEHLLRELESADRTADSDDEFISELLLRIYEQQTHIVIRDQIDRRVRVLSSRGQSDVSPAMKKLLQRSRRNRLDMWDEAPEKSDELFEHAAVGLERWASAYIRTDRVRLNQHLRRQCLAGLAQSWTAPDTTDKPLDRQPLDRQPLDRQPLDRQPLDRQPLDRWLAMAVDHRIAVYRWDAMGKLELEATEVFELEAGDGARAVLRLPGDTCDHLLVLTHAGKLCLLGFEPRRGLLSPAMTQELRAWESGYARALACCPHPRRGTVIAVIQQHDRRSTLNLLHLDEGHLQPLNSEPLDLAWIRHIDLARAEDGYQLLAGAGQAAPLRLYQLDAEGRIHPTKQASHNFHILHSGASALRFSSVREPRFALGGEHNGLLWCLDLAATSAAKRLAWTFQLDGAVRAIERVLVDGEAHFLIGSEGGTLVLLRARDGQRVWKDFLDEPIREVVACDPAGHDVAVTMSRGWVATYRAMDADERDQALTAVKSHLARLAEELPNDDPAWRSPAYPATVRAFYRLLHDQLATDQVLATFDDRETRARIVRWLAQQATGLQDAAILHGFSLRDLNLLLCYLPDEPQPWDPLAAKELQRRTSKEDDAARSRKGILAVATTLLRRQTAHGIDPTDLLDHLPSNVFWHSPWLRLEALRAFCRLTWEKAEDQRLFPRLLFPLLRWPPDLVMNASDVFPYRSQEKEDFLALSLMLRELVGPGSMTAASLERLAEALGRSQKVSRRGLLGLLTELHTLMAHLADEESDHGSNGGWTLYRRPAIAALEAVAHRAHELTDPPPAAEPLVEGLRAFLRRQPLPPETATLEERARQLELARRRLDEPQQDDHASDQHPWAPFITALLDRTRQITGALIHREYLHVLNQVRPRLTLLQAQRTPTNRVALRCKAEAEGHRQLSDVTIRFRSRGDHGLLPPGTLLNQFEAFIYPGMFPTHEFELAGYVRPDQSEVMIEVSLEDKDGYRAEDRWSFGIPVAEAAQTGKRSTLGTFFPQCESTFLEAVFETSSPVLFVVLDPELGRQTFLEAWHERFPGRWLDLDTALRDYGPGRRYSAQPLDPKLIEETLNKGIAAANAEVDEGKTSPEPFLLGPIDEVVQRLLDADEHKTLRHWSSQLEERAQRQRRPNLVLLISSLHACELRRFLSVPLPEVAAHRVLRAAWARPRHQILEQEALSYLEKETRERETHLSATAVSAVVRSWLSRLGGDLRLILLWLRWREERQPGTPIQFQAFLDSRRVHDLILGELRSLSTLDLIHVLLGAEAETTLPLSRLRSAHRAARTHRSTPRKSSSTPKDLTRPGEPFTAAVISRLQSDRNPPATLRVQGFGTAGPSEAPRSRLLALATSRPLELRVASFDRLDRLGFGAWAEDVFRTASPYRAVIAELYSRFSDVALDLRDTRVYARIVGEHRTPAEAITATDLSDLDADYLQTLMPGARSQDLKALRRWAQAVRGTSNEEPELVLAAIFAPDRVTRLDHLDGRWDESLGKLGLPLFGIGHLPGLRGQNPRTYLYWLDATASVDLSRIYSALDQAAARWQELKQEDGELGSIRRPMRLYLFGPGAESLPSDPDRRIAILHLSDGREAAWGGHLADGLRRKARAKLRLTAFSPFQTNGALPPGSQLFVGREREIEFIKARLRQVSILIVGGRRVGKTSLLNQIYLWAKDQSDLEPIYIDLQGVKTRIEFLKALYSESQNDELGELGEITRTHLPVIADQEARSGLRNIAQAIKSRHRLPIFLLNEVDGLMENDPDLIEIWRGLNDDGLARFLMVGYSVIATLGTPKSPFFHFTEGNSFAGRAVAPTALSTSAAARLLDLLETSELELQWRSAAEKETAHAELLKRSYRIPWVLQRYGQLLVEHLESYRHDVLTWDDVQHVLERESDVVWQYIDAIDYQNLGYREPQAIHRPGFQLVLFALARKIYFAGDDPPIRDPRLRERQAIDPEARRGGIKDLSFTVGDARQTVQDAIAELLIGDERQAVEQWLGRLDLEQALRLLTLTLTLEPDPVEHGRYGFLLHIVPLELNRLHGRTDPSLDELILDKAARFMQLMS